MRETRIDRNCRIKGINMKTIKDINQINITPFILAQDAGKRIIKNIIDGRIKSKMDIELAINKCGKGAEFVRRTQHYAMALTLVS